MMHGDPPGGGLVRRSLTLSVPLWVVVSSSSLEWEEAKSRERWSRLSSLSLSLSLRLMALTPAAEEI